MGCASVGARRARRASRCGDRRARGRRRGPVGRWRCSPRLSRREEWMARVVNAQVPEVVQSFWAALQGGEFIADAAVAVGTYRKQGTRWVAACGGVRPRRGRELKGRCLTFAEREEIALARAHGEPLRGIARRLGRSPSTISRELRRNADRSGGY